MSDYDAADWLPREGGRYGLGLRRVGKRCTYEDRDGNQCTFEANVPDSTGCPIHAKSEAVAPRRLMPIL